jgi:membrane-associated phospholipid phosphatase
MEYKLTALGDSALLLPAALLVLVILLAQGERGTALAWVAAMAACGAATLLAKIVFGLCGPRMEAFDISSPSGHAAVSTVFYGSLAVVLSSRRPVWLGLLVWAAALATIAMIGVTRLLMGVHSHEEVALGLLTGLLGLLVFALLHRRAGRPRIRLAPLVVGFALAVALFGGLHVGFEEPIRRLSRGIRAWLDICR